MKEIWKEIKGYEGLYEISNYGKVKSCDKMKGTNYSCFSSGKIKQVRDNGIGYLFATLCKKGIKKGKYIHILVATHFVDNPDNKPEVNHDDGNKYNNHFGNLIWSTRKENESHAWRTGLKNMVGKNHFASKPVIQMDLSGNEIKEWESSNMAGTQLKISGSHIRKCCKGELLTSYGFKWKFA